MSSKINVTVWNEYRHEKNSPEIAKVYPNGMHGAIKEGLDAGGRFNVRTATLDEPQNGLTDEVLAETDVLFWWGHMAHGDVENETVGRVYKRIMEGMGFIALHSAHDSKIFKRLMGTDSGRLKWREDGKLERLWVINPSHPIAEGVGDFIEIPQTEMYGEQFVIPAPDEIIFISWFEGGEVFRSGITFNRGLGKIFYFRPGHESFPIFYQPEVRKVLANAAAWAAPIKGAKYITGHYMGPGK